MKKAATRRPARSPREEALDSLAASAAANIPGVDLVSISARERNGPLSTLVCTDPLARCADTLQYELEQGPCYATVTAERFVLINDLAASTDYPAYAPRALALGIAAQASIQLVHQRQTAALNLYALTPDAFDRSTVEFAELFATQAGALLGFAEQVEQLSEALHTRTDIGTAVGILMERYGIDRQRAFAFLTRNSQTRNVKVRVLAQAVIDGTFQSTTAEDTRSGAWP